MSKQLASVRHQHILSELQASGRVQVEALAADLSTSAVTIRKDLSQLESEGLLVRRHGGAVLASDASDLGERVSERQQAIARAAAGLGINPNTPSTLDKVIGALAAKYLKVDIDKST